MRTLELADLRNGYVELLDWLVRHSYPVPSRDGETHEVTGATLVFSEPGNVMLPIGVNRRVNTKLAAVETLQLLSGTCDPELLRLASPGYTEVLVDPTDVAYGAYGLRTRYQLEQVYRELYHHRDSRRAVVVIWREDDLLHTGDRPCTLTLQFLIRRDHLELIVNMRSQDAWLGVPYDVFMFSQFQLSLARQLGVGVGRYTHHVGSLHLYERNVEAAGALLPCRSDRPTPVDYPRGVVAPVSGGDLFTEVAERLVTRSFDEHEALANPWYLRQLAQLGVARLTDVEVDH